MADDIALASLSLTHVYYDPNDPVSYLCAWLALVPQALCIVYVTLIWSTREAEVALMFAGQLGCEAVNFVLKRLIKEERPSRIHKTGKGYGMPSSHAQFVVFWAVAMVLFLLARHAPSWSHHGYGPRGRGVDATTTNGGVGGGGNGNGTVQDGGSGRSDKEAGAPPPARPRRGIWDQDWVALESYAHRPWSLAERAAASVLVLSVAAAVAWSRVYLGYHTVTQVLAGCLAGALSALAWYGATHVVRETGLLAWALESPVARSLRIRDLVVSEDLCQAGWEKWEERKFAAVQSSRKDKVR
ncbi:hypothetical protein VPNG_05612 [Cytospora leucostoma]|uniref:Dolichyldiphosphatase n=1 Tax=Cytospora leucostoma TaxID=1230097 RepID=A0A423X7L2_9PEZI|nr:hypothetical protein VPNG_05612 [Cytospora leucostoma]